MKLHAGWMALLAAFTAVAGAQETPTINLSTNNCIVRFVVPATWGAIKGEVKELTGWARFDRPGDLHSLRGMVGMDITALTTHSEGRDRKWQEECLERGRYPKISFTLEWVKVTENRSFLLTGHLTLRDTTHPLVIGGQFAEEEGCYHLTGGGSMKWSDYGVRDASNFFTKMRPDTKVLVELWLPLK
jgi:polyisoprenoid-binding protein YceI